MTVDYLGNEICIGDIVAYHGYSDKTTFRDLSEGKVIKFISDKSVLIECCYIKKNVAKLEYETIEEYKHRTECIRQLKYKSKNIINLTALGFRERKKINENS